MKELMKQDEHAAELERKEKGFILYLNGANAKLNLAPFFNLPLGTSRRPKSCKSESNGSLI